MALEQNRLPDICRSRHRGNEQSESANIRVHPQKKIDRDRILAYADFIGSRGITFKEVCSDLNMKPQSASARLAELKADQKLVQKDCPNRDGCGVFVVVKKVEQQKLF